MVRNEKTKNPFVIEGYVSPDYFCDREKETALLTRHLTNGCNVTLMAPRRLGKSGLVFNCFNQREVREAYHCIYVDIYETKNLDEFVYDLNSATVSKNRLLDSKLLLRCHGALFECSISRDKPFHPLTPQSDLRQYAVSYP